MGKPNDPLVLAVGAIIKAQTPNTTELANVLSVSTERQDMREQWLRRLLQNSLLESAVILEPFARAEREAAAWNGQTVILSLDQTDLGNRFAVLMLAVQALAMYWCVCWPARCALSPHSP